MGLLSFLGLSKTRYSTEGVPLRAETPKEKAYRIGERISVLEALTQSYRFDPDVCIDTPTKTYKDWLTELATLRFQLSALMTEQKERPVIDRLTAENANLLNDLVAAENRYQRDVYGLNNEGDPIGGEPPSGFYNDAQRYKALWQASQLPEVKHSELVIGQYYWEIGRVHFPVIVQWNGAPMSHRPSGGKFFGPILPPELPPEESACANPS